jgi:hypothetical protein
MHDGCDLGRGFYHAAVRALSTIAGGLRKGLSNTKATDFASFVDACLEMSSRWLGRSSGW